MGRSWGIDRRAAELDCQTVNRDSHLAPEVVGKRRANSPRFARFAEAYRRSGNAYRAALLAGYSPKMAKARSYELARLVPLLRDDPASEPTQLRQAQPVGFAKPIANRRWRGLLE